MALISASSAAKTASATIAANTQSSPNGVLISEFQYLFDTIQATATAGQTSLVFDLTTLSHISNDITSLVNYLTTNGYHVTNVGNNYTITWGAVTTNGSVTTVNPTSPITAITPASISVTSGTTTSTIFIPIGGIAPYTYTCTTPPSGLSFNAGTLSGTPVLSTGYYTVTVGVTDSLGQTFSQIVTILATAPAITGINPNSVQGQVDVAFAAAFIPTGGTGPYTFRTSGSVPAGLTFGSTSSVNALTLLGTPSTAGNDYNTLTISVTDSLGQTFNQLITWTIATATTGTNITWPVTNTTGSSGPTAIAIGQNTSVTLGNGVAIGGGASVTNGDAVAIGINAAATNGNSIAIGPSSAASMSSVSIGASAGGVSQGTQAVAIGTNAGGSYQSTDAVAIGVGAGKNAQGYSSVAIGAFAGQGVQGGTGNAQADNTIILNATGNPVNGVANQTNSFYVAPVRGVTSTGSWSNPTHQLPSGFYMVAYNPTTKEFIYWS